MDSLPFSTIIQKYTEKLENFNINLKNKIQVNINKFYDQSLFESFKKEYKKALDTIFLNDNPVFQL